MDYTAKKILKLLFIYTICVPTLVFLFILIGATLVSSTVDGVCLDTSDVMMGSASFNFLDYLILAFLGSMIYYITRFAEYILFDGTKSILNELEEHFKEKYSPKETDSEDTEALTK